MEPEQARLEKQAHSEVVTLENQAVSFKSTNPLQQWQGNSNTSALRRKDHY